MLLPVMEETISLAGATHTKSNGILWSAQKRAEFLLILFNYLDCRSRTGWIFNPKAFRHLHGAGLHCQASSEVQVPFQILHVQWSKVTIKLAGDKCLAYNGIKTPTLFGLHACRELYLSSFATGQSLLRDTKDILVTTWKSYALVVPHVYKQAKF